MLYGGSIPPGTLPRATTSRSRTSSRPSAPTPPARSPTRSCTSSRTARQPGRRRLRRPVHRQHDGDGLRGHGHLARWAPRMVPAAGRAARPRSPRTPASSSMDVLERGLRPRDIITRESLENAIAARRDERRLDQRRAAPARGRPRGRRRRSTIDDFDRISASDAADSATSSPAAGTSPSTSTRPAACRSSPSACSRPGCSTRTRSPSTGQHDRRGRRRAPIETEGQEVVRPLDDPLKPTGGLAILQGNLAPEGCVVKLAGHERRYHQRPGARLRARGGRDGRRHARRHQAPATSSSSATRAPPAAPACARCSPSPPRSSATASASTSRCSPTAASRGATHGFMAGHVAPEAANGGPIAAVREGDTITIDVDNRRLDVDLSDEEIAERVAAYELAAEPGPHRRAGKYAALVASASAGRRHRSSAVARSSGRARLADGLRDRTPMRIAIDIDSTLHHYWDRLSDAADERFGIDLPYEQQSPGGSRGCEPEQLPLCISATHADAAIAAGQPYPGAVETVNRWHEAGHFIHVTSHRAPTAARRDRALARRRSAWRYDELHCSCDKVAPLRRDRHRRARSTTARSNLASAPSKRASPRRTLAPPVERGASSRARGRHRARTTGPELAARARRRCSTRRLTPPLSAAVSAVEPRQSPSRRRACSLASPHSVTFARTSRSAAAIAVDPSSSPPSRRPARLAGGACAYDPSRNDTIAEGVASAASTSGARRASRARQAERRAARRRCSEPIVVAAGTQRSHAHARARRGSASTSTRTRRRRRCARSATATSSAHLRGLTGGRSTMTSRRASPTTDDAVIAPRHARARALDRGPSTPTSTFDRDGLSGPRRRARASTTARCAATIRARARLSDGRARRSTSAPHETAAEGHDRRSSPRSTRGHHRRPRRASASRSTRTSSRPRATPIAVGAAGLETPAGLYTIQNKRSNPSWHVPGQRLGGQPRGKVDPARPDNPIKARWMGIYNGAGIHGTDDVGSLGTRRLARLRAHGDPRRRWTCTTGSTSGRRSTSPERP